MKDPTKDLRDWLDKNKLTWPSAPQELLADLAAAHAARERAEGMYIRQSLRADMLARDAAHYHDRATKAEAERDRLREVVREVEWGGDYHDTSTANDYPCCPECGGLQPAEHLAEYKPRRAVVGHAPDCKLAEALESEKMKP